MNIIRKRIPQIHNVRPDDFRLIKEVAQERCGICWDRWPSSMMTTEDGLRRCPDCLAIRTEEVKAEIRQHDAERVAERQTRPQISQAPLAGKVVPWIRVMQDVALNNVTSISPLLLRRGGAAVVLTLLGGGFASTDTFSYSSGITDSIAPALTTTKTWTLTLVASGGMAAGDWNLTYNNHTYRRLFKVR